MADDDWRNLSLETPRLIMRPPRAEDFDSWAAMMADAENSRHIGGPLPRALAWRGFTCVAGSWQMQGYSMFSVLEKSSGRWLGRVGPWHPEGWPGREVGWALIRAAWGQGFAIEAATAAMNFAFDTLGWDEVVHSIAPDNVSSQMLARRLGSSLRGPAQLPAPYEDLAVDLWGQTRTDWRERRPS
ncbi:MAG: GNAT family N-acetyltransferase [Rhodanobacteraceae bacterium]